jgi:hypothetical protein
MNIHNKNQGNVEKIKPDCLASTFLQGVLR